MQIGDRIIVKERRGTIRFIGNLEHYQGEWVGVDYDDPEDGKHDGTLNGKRYFTSNGAFVKTHLVDAGYDLVTAIEDRYTDSKVHTSIEDGIILSNAKIIELIGMEKVARKQGNIYALTAIVLDSRNVSSPPPVGTALFKRCRELNLYNNLLHRWEDVEEMLRYFPVLEELVLRKNQMDIASDSTAPIAWNCSPQLTALILSDCGVCSKTISYVLACISSAVNLYALRNQITRFEVSVEMASRLQILDLEGNPLNSIDNVMGQYPNLQKLSLVKCNLMDVDLTESNRFPKLEHLNLLDNEITRWDSIMRLRHLPLLSTLFINTALFKAENDITPSEVTTALLPTLKDLNRFDIKATERRSAEIRFINKYSGIPEDRKKIFEDDLKRLVKIWGAPVTDVIRGPSVVKLTISDGNKTMEKTLPLEITVNRLTEMLCRLFSVNSHHTKLFLEKKEPHYRIQLANPVDRFAQYSPEPTDILFLAPAKI